MLVRDEADVIAQCLDGLLTWADAIYLYDLGSTDATWDIIREYAARDERIVPFLHRPTVFTDGLRSVLFDRYRCGFEAGDWVLRVDADEFYPVPPPTFVRERLTQGESAAYLQWYFFRLTTAEAAAYESGAVSIDEDRLRPIRERRRYYKVSRYAEPRMFRYRPAIRWPEYNFAPFNAGLVARERIPILHYPHRDPRQMQARFRLRAAMIARKAAAGSHWNQADWREDLVDAASGVTNNVLRTGGVAGLASHSEVDSGPLLYWEPGTPLPEVHLHSHLAPWPKRALQRLAHAALLPLLDRRRPAFDPAYRPQFLSEEESARLGA